MSSISCVTVISSRMKGEVYTGMRRPSARSVIRSPRKSRARAVVIRRGGYAEAKLDEPASVAQWKSSSVLRKRLGVRVPPGAQLFFASDQGFLLWSDHRNRVFAH